MWGIRVQSSGQGNYDLTCHEAAKPVPICHNKEPEQSKIILKRKKENREPAPGINSPQGPRNSTDFLGNCAVEMRQ